MITLLKIIFNLNSSKNNTVHFSVFKLFPYSLTNEDTSDELNNKVFRILLCPFVIVTIAICCYFNSKIYLPTHNLKVISHVIVNSFLQSRQLLTSFNSGQSIRRSFAGGPEISCTRIKSENSRQVKQRSLFPGGPGINLMPFTLILCVFS